METRQHNQIRLAQNFLRSPKLVRRLVELSTIGSSDTVYEIGPGNGIITAALAHVAKRVIAIEKDPRLVRRLRERFGLHDNVEIVEQDFLAYSLQTANAKLDAKLFANIPYNHTAQILRRILQVRSNIDEAYLILQKEAAQKFSGSPRETLCSILAKPFFEFKIEARLKRTDFRPVPNVDSVLLSIKRRRQTLLPTQEVASFRDFVQYGFKRWKPNLRLAYKHLVTYKQWKHLARDVGFPLNATPTELSFEQWLDLYRTCMKSVRNPTREVKLCSPE
jgi:23S rRNA (adenine-N6)-dimethyltransferase